MKLYLIFCLFFNTIIGFVAGETPTDKIECLCPEENNQDECESQVICVYGINDIGEIFFYGKNDKMDLMKIALQRMEEIGNFNVDDVLVNLYTPEKTATAIFYYACRECDDLKAFANSTNTTSLYNQRMKYNLKYAQSDFEYFTLHFDGSTDEQQPMPVITVRPFWKNRLILNQTCAQKQERFTQKHFIPAFLTQELCILDYQYSQYFNDSTADSSILYSLTMSYNDVYSYQIVINSTQELSDLNQNEQCKISINFDSLKRSLRFFCLCNTNDCTLKVTKNDPQQSCPHVLGAEINTAAEYKSITNISDFIGVDDLFAQADDIYCYFTWETTDDGYFASIQRLQDHSILPDGYFVNSNHDGECFRCPFKNYTKEDLDYFHATFYRNDTLKLQQVFLNTITDHSKIINDIQPIGANCSSEGTFSDPFYSSGYGSQLSIFPCYHYYEIYSKKQLYPMMGYNILPISIISKGKECYYYTMKIDNYHLSRCEPPLSMPPVITIVACPEDIDFDEAELLRMQKIVGACPTMASNESKWEYKAPETNETEIICGQFLYGLKMENGKYVPKEIELRQVNEMDLELIQLNSTKHGCGFDSSQNLTICTCYAALGGCDDLYTVGRVHLLRYLPFDDDSDDEE